MKAQLPLRLILRGLAKNRVYTGINMSGLIIGMAGAMIIFQLVSYHLRVDRYHQKANRTYRVVVDLHLDDGSVEKEKGLAYVLHETLKKEFGMVEDAGYLARRELTFDVSQKGIDKRFLEKEAAVFANTDFFKIFDFEWKAGNASVLNEPGKVVLTERYALKYFGNSNPVGMTMKVNHRENLVVAGILKNYPKETDFKNDIFISLPTIKKIVPEYGYEDWGWIDGARETFVALQAADQQAAFESQMPAFSKRYYGADGHIFRYHLQPLSDLHFNVNYGGTIKRSTLIMLASVGALLILIACFNFINISTARSLKRSKEVGVRKMLGVSPAQIFWLLMQETAILTFVSYLIALVLAALAAPVLSQWLDIPLELKIFSDPSLLAFSFFLVFAVTALAGIYPAVVISRFRPLLAIQGLGEKTGKNTISIRKGLVVAQFAISFTLVTVSTVIILQSYYLQNKDLGQDKQLILHLPLPETESVKSEVLRNELLKLPEVKEIAFFRTAPSSQTGGGGSIKFENRDWEKFVARSKVADHQYTKTYGLRFIAGRAPAPSDTVRELLVNSTMVKALGLKSPEEALGKRLFIGDIGKSGVISGVLSDFNNADLYTEIEPIVLYSSSDRYRNIAVKLGGFSRATLSEIRQKWQSQFPEYVFEYRFYDDEIAAFYKREQLATRLTTTFALLSIFLSCLGLLGLAIFMIEQRTKEIGIRKVLGASVASVSALLSFDFLKLVGVAILIAAPAAWYFADRWLQDFAFRINLDWWIFAGAAGLSVLVASATIGYQAIAAAFKNPVDILR